jgi:hypothetical protein
MAQVIEGLPRKREARSSKCSTTKKKQQKKKEGRKVYIAI